MQPSEASLVQVYQCVSLGVRTGFKSANIFCKNNSVEYFASYLASTVSDIRSSSARSFGEMVSRLSQTIFWALFQSFPDRLNAFIELLFRNFAHRPKPRPGHPWQGNQSEPSGKYWTNESLSMRAAQLWLVTLLGVSVAGFCTMWEITKQYLNKIIQSTRKCLK